MKEKICIFLLKFLKVTADYDRIIVTYYFAVSMGKGCKADSLSAMIMNNIAVANETIKITAEGYFEADGKRTELPKCDYAAVTVYSPEKCAELVNKTVIPDAPMCQITVTTEDSFAAAKRFENSFVMNFANAHCPGGGFRLGANAQEEALCRCSTLYASITSEAAKEMYIHNNTRINPVESDYMLYSPNVCVFRDEKCSLTDSPFMSAVITLPAPNRRGAAVVASGAKIAEAMIRRIRIMLAIAAENGHKNLILGAWGCGAFGNKPDDVSGYFRKVIIDEGYGKLFEHICFAVYGKENSRNYLAFKKTFS